MIEDYYLNTMGNYSTKTLHKLIHVNTYDTRVKLFLEIAHRTAINILDELSGT